MPFVRFIAIVVPMNLMSNNIIRLQHNAMTDSRVTWFVVVHLTCVASAWLTETRVFQQLKNIISLV